MQINMENCPIHVNDLGDNPILMFDYPLIRMLAENNAVYILCNDLDEGDRPTNADARPEVA